MDSPRSASVIDLTVANALSAAPRVVLAVSGGLDSMVLLEAASTVAPAPGVEIAVATFDHGTGKAARDAAALVRRRSAELGLECFAGRADRPLASEAAFREERWRFLRETAGRFGPGTAVATAHTLDDQIETVLMRIMRGSGTRGLAALFASTGVIRPLLSFRRADLQCYASARCVSSIEDPSNATPRFTRNRVRHDLLPALRQAAPDFDEHLLKIARRAADWRDDLDAYVDRELDLRLPGGGLDVSAVKLAGCSTAALAVLWPAIAARAGASLDRRGIARLAAFSRSGRVGARIQLSDGWEVTRSRDAFQLRASESPVTQTDTAAMPVGTSKCWGGAWSFHAVEPDRMPANTSWAAWLPAEPAPMVRRWAPGDAVTVGNGSGPVSVKRLLSRAGVTGYDRRRWPVVVAGERILWIPGVCRTDAVAGWKGESRLPFVCEYHAS